MKNFNEVITDFDCLYKAFQKSKNRRSYKASAMYFELDLISELEKIKAELANKTYEVSGYYRFKVFHPKEREIMACKFRDKVVQHLICDNMLAEYFPKICVDDSYAGQKGKGTSYGRGRLKSQIEQFTQENGVNGYFYKGDIHRFYYNIDHKKAVEIMESFFPADTHWLIEKFINSTDGKGIALGNQINTIISNLYLNGFDKFIKEELNIKFYGRYADDFYLIHDSKNYLKYCENQIKLYLETLSLELNPKSQIIPLKNGISFIGFHFYPNGRIKVINQKERAYRRKFNKMLKLVLNGEISLDNLLKSYQSWENHASFCTDHKIFNYYKNKIKELEKSMLIKNGYYISRRTSKVKPYTHINGDTLFLPYDVKKDNELFKFSEYRINLPITNEIDTDVLKKIIENVPDTLKQINSALKNVFGEKSNVNDLPKYAKAIATVKDTAVKSDDKTLGIAMSFSFAVWENGIYDLGDVRTDPETGYPYECITPHDSIANPDWTIDNRTLWKPWHSRSTDYALPYEQPTGAHDMYKNGEYMIWTDKLIYKAIADTAYSPDVRPEDWAAEIN